MSTKKYSIMKIAQRDDMLMNEYHNTVINIVNTFIDNTTYPFN